MSIEHYYTERPVIVSHTTSTGWSNEPGWGSATTIDAAVNPSDGNERFSAGKVTRYADYKMYCSDTVSIGVTDRVRYGGDTFEAVFVKDTLNRGHHKKVLLVYAR